MRRAKVYFIYGVTLKENTLEAVKAKFPKREHQVRELKKAGYTLFFNNGEAITGFCGQLLRVVDEGEVVHLADIFRSYSTVFDRTSITQKQPSFVSEVKTNVDQIPTWMNPGSSISFYMIWSTEGIKP